MLKHFCGPVLDFLSCSGMLKEGSQKGTILQRITSKAYSKRNHLLENLDPHSNTTFKDIEAWMKLEDVRGREVVKTLKLRVKLGLATLGELVPVGHYLTCCTVELLALYE